jgi:CRP-like cAMP-binding protein
MDDLIPFLKKTKVFHNLTEEELRHLFPLARRATYEKDAYIVREGEQGDELFLIQSGAVEILKRDKEHQTDYRLAVLNEDDSFGEMAILGTQTRMSSAKALEKTQIVIFHLKDLKTLAEKSPVFAKLFTNLAHKSVKRLESANQATVNSLKEEMRLIKAHDQMARFIIYLFIFLTAFVYALKFFEKYNSYTAVTQIVISMFIISFGVFGIVMIKYSGYPLEFYGLTMKNWKKNLGETLLFTLPLLLGMIPFKWMLIQTIPEFHDLTVFPSNKEPQHSFLFKAFDHLFGKPQKEMHIQALLIFYVALVPVQEFIARGCLQSALRNFFRSPYRVFWSIFASNLIFGLFHGMKSFTFALCAFCFGLFWGWLYERQKSLVGPILSHALIGIWAFGVLSYQSVLIH